MKWIISVIASFFFIALYGFATFLFVAFVLFVIHQAWFSQPAYMSARKRPSASLATPALRSPGPIYLTSAPRRRRGLRLLAFAALADNTEWRKVDYHPPYDPGLWGRIGSPNDLANM